MNPVPAFASNLQFERLYLPSELFSCQTRLYDSDYAFLGLRIQESEKRMNSRFVAIHEEMAQSYGHSRTPLSPPPPPLPPASTNTWGDFFVLKTRTGDSQQLAKHALITIFCGTYLL